MARDCFTSSCGGVPGNPLPGRKDHATSNPWLRAAAGAEGLGNIALGVAKISIGVGVTAESGGLAVGLGYYSAYSGGLNIVGGASHLYGALTGDLEGGQEVADYATSVSSVSGAVTLVATGNPQTGATASTIEGVALVGATGGLTTTGALPIPEAKDIVVTVIDGVSAVYPLIVGK